MFCTFCNREVDPINHILKCPECGAKAHEVEEFSYECEGCGRRFRLPIHPIVASDDEPELDTRREGEFPMSENDRKRQSRKG
jgi:DNA-directed RNA polymerase subunit RPC12/RpoP